MFFWPTEYICNWMCENHLICNCNLSSEVQTIDCTFERVALRWPWDPSSSIDACSIVRWFNCDSFYIITSEFVIIVFGDNCVSTWQITLVQPLSLIRMRVWYPVRWGPMFAPKYWLLFKDQDLLSVYIPLMQERKRSDHSQSRWKCP